MGWRLLDIPLLGVLLVRPISMATELNDEQWVGDEPVAEPEAADGWGDAEQEVPLPMEETPVSDVKLFNKW